MLANSAAGDSLALGSSKSFISTDSSMPAPSLWRFGEYQNDAF